MKLSQSQRHARAFLEVAAKGIKHFTPEEADRILSFLVGEFSPVLKKIEREIEEARPRIGRPRGTPGSPERLADILKDPSEAPRIEGVLKNILTTPILAAYIEALRQAGKLNKKAANVEAVSRVIKNCGGYWRGNAKQLRHNLTQIRQNPSHPLYKKRVAEAITKITN